MGVCCTVWWNRRAGCYCSLLLLLSISAHRHLIDEYVPCMRGVKKKFDNVQINVIIIYSGAVWLKLCTVD